MKKNLIEGLIKNEVRKEEINLTLNILEIEDRDDIDFDTKMKKLRKIFKDYGYNTKETNQRIRNKEDWYMEEKTKNEVAIFKDGKVLVSFTAEEFNYLDDLIHEVIAFSEEELNEVRKDEEQLQGRAWGSLTEMIELDVYNSGRDRITRYKKRLAKSVLSKIEYGVKEEDGLYIVEEFYNFRYNSAIRII